MVVSKRENRKKIRNTRVSKGCLKIRLSVTLGTKTCSGTVKKMFVRSAKTFAMAAKRNEGEGGGRVCVVCFIDFRFTRNKK